MKTMAQKAGLGPNFKNHSGRKTMIQILVNNDVPPTDILCNCQDTKLTTLPSHTVNMSHTLTGLSSGEIAPQSGSSIPERRKHEFDQYPPGTALFSCKVFYKEAISVQLSNCEAA